MCSTYFGPAHQTEWQSWNIKSFEKVGKFDELCNAHSFSFRKLQVWTCTAWYYFIVQYLYQVNIAILRYFALYKHLTRYWMNMLYNIEKTIWIELDNCSNKKHYMLFISKFSIFCLPTSSARTKSEATRGCQWNQG